MITLVKELCIKKYKGGYMKKKKYVYIEFVECPFCGYNNEPKRFQYYGTCLRCHEIIDKKIYLKRKIYEAKNNRKLKERFL